MFAAYSLALAWSALAQASPVATSTPGSALAGRWLLTLPAGFEYDADIEPGGEAGLYRLRCGALNLRGLYELRGQTLTLVEADNPHLAGLAWVTYARPGYQHLPGGPMYGWAVYTAFGPEVVEVPAGRFAAIRVEQESSPFADKAVKSTSWYAPGVGLVKKVHPDGSAQVLKSFTPGR